MDRGKVVRSQEEMDSMPEYGRYRDVDGDGIAYRTLPGAASTRSSTGEQAMMRMVYTQRTPRYTTIPWLG